MLLAHHQDVLLMHTFLFSFRSMFEVWLTEDGYKVPRCPQHERMQLFFWNQGQTFTDGHQLRVVI